MAALTLPTSVQPTADTQLQVVLLGATVAVGQSVYQDNTDSNKYKLADADLSIDAAASRGVAMTAGVAGDYCIIATGGTIVMVGTTLAKGKSYYVGAAGGAIVPETDLAATYNVVRMGTAPATNQLTIAIQKTGILL